MDTVQTRVIEKNWEYIVEWRNLSEFGENWYSKFGYKFSILGEPMEHAKELAITKAKQLLKSTEGVIVVWDSEHDK